MFRVKHLVTGESLDVHASRLKFFADKDFEVTEELLEHVAAQGIILCVCELIRHPWNKHNRTYEVLVGWHGLETIEDSWEPLVGLCKDVNTLVQAYVFKKPKTQNLKVISGHWKRHKRDVKERNIGRFR